jgi:hypothetical protein
MIECTREALEAEIAALHADNNFLRASNRELSEVVHDLRLRLRDAEGLITQQRLRLGDARARGYCP